MGVSVWATRPTLRDEPNKAVHNDRDILIARAAESCGEMHNSHWFTKSAGGCYV